MFFHGAAHACLAPELMHHGSEVKFKKKTREILEDRQRQPQEVPEGNLAAGIGSGPRLQQRIPSHRGDLRVAESLSGPAGFETSIAAQAAGLHSIYAFLGGAEKVPNNLPVAPFEAPNSPNSTTPHIC